MDRSRETAAALEDESLREQRVHLGGGARTHAQISTGFRNLKHGSARIDWVKKIITTVIQAPLFLYYGDHVERWRNKFTHIFLSGEIFMIKLISKSKNEQEARLRAANAFNLFRRKEEPELLCAVPEDRAVPSFIAGETWEFGGRISGSSREHPGFDANAASAAARYNGFYLFQAWKPCVRSSIRVA